MKFRVMIDLRRQQKLLLLFCFLLLAALQQRTASFVRQQKQPPVSSASFLSSGRRQGLAFVSAAAIERRHSAAAAASVSSLFLPAAPAALPKRHWAAATIAAAAPAARPEQDAETDVVLPQQEDDERTAGSSRSREGFGEGDIEDEEEAIAEGRLPLPTLAAAAAAAAESEDGAEDTETEENPAAAAAGDGLRKDWLSPPLSAAKRAQRAALRALRRSREKSDAPTWRSFLSRLPPEEDEAKRNEREGLPPPHARTIEQLPIKTLNVGRDTILYRQALDSSPMFVDLQTFDRLKQQWADNPEELKRLQREDKAEYGIDDGVPDEDWVPVRRDLPKGRLVVSHGLIPVNATTDEPGYDYVEKYYDPKRDYTWSYKHYNPYKAGGDTSEGEGEEMSPYYRLESEEARRYYLKEPNPPERETDDGIFRQATLAEEMIRGIRRSPEGEEQWDFIPEAPFGQLAPQQNFARTINPRDFPWIRRVLAERHKRERDKKEAEKRGAEKHKESAESKDAPDKTAARKADEEVMHTKNTINIINHAEQASKAAEPLPPPPPLPKLGDPLPSVEEAFHRQYRHVALPLPTGCATPKLYLPQGRLPRVPLATRTPPWSISYRQLGKSDLYVSEVGIGTMFFGGPQGPPAGEGNYNNYADLLSYAVDGWGVNFIDTAELYPLPALPESFGVAEKILGRWLARRGPAKRGELIIATKVAGPARELSWLKRGKEKESDTTCLSKAQIVAAVDGSLRRLRLAYLDLVQLHWPQRYVPSHATGDAPNVLFDIPTAAARESEAQRCSMEEQLDAIEQLLKDGKIRAWGLSNETPYGLLRFCQLAKARGIPQPASCQVHYNLLFRNDVEKQFVEAVRPQNTGVSLVAYGALAGGLLTGKYLEWLEYPTAGRLLRFPSYMTRLRGSMAARAVREYFYLARKFEQPNLTTVSLKWVYSRPFITTTLLGFSDYYQLRENLHCLHPAAGAMTDWMEREINFIHWKWRDPLRLIQ